MKHLIILLLSIPVIAVGQQIEILNTAVQTATGQINLAAEELSGVVSANGVQLALNNSELSIQYQLPELGEEGRFYEVIPAIKLNGTNILLLPHEEFRGDWKELQIAGQKQIMWIDLLNRYVQLEGTLEVELTIHRWGERKLPYDCNLGEPQFTSRQRLPYYIAAGVGVASIGAGQIFKAQAQRIYDDEYLNASSFAEADPLYQDANQKHQTYLILTYVGAGILVADVTLFVIRYSKYRKNKALYEEYCADRSTGMVPRLKLSTSLVAGTPGVKLKWNF